MKTKKLNTKLEFKKATVVTLTTKSQQDVKGGYYYTRINGGTDCYTWHPACWTLPTPNCLIID